MKSPCATCGTVTEHRTAMISWDLYALQAAAHQAPCGVPCIGGDDADMANLERYHRLDGCPRCGGEKQHAPASESSR